MQVSPNLAPSFLALVYFSAKWGGWRQGPDALMPLLGPSTHLRPTQVLRLAAECSCPSTWPW